jgi:hypothetical protein
MASISITIPDAVLSRVLDAFAARYGWESAGGQTKAQFAKSRVIEFIRDVVRAHEATAVAEAARVAAVAAVNADIVLS